MSKQAEGGRARAAKLTPQERQEIAKQAAKARWAKPDESLPKATHSGDLHIGEISIPCAVLEDGTRVLSENGMTQAILGSRSGASKRIKRLQEQQGAPLPLFVAPGNLKSYINNDLLAGPLKPILYRVGRRTVAGFGADVLPAVCDIWLKAREEGKLQDQQLDKAKKAELLMRGLAHVGIRALIDEATGFQAERDRDDLEKFLSRYLSKERLKWVSTYPSEFFSEIFRLKPGWKRPLSDNARPPAMGHIINRIVYDELPEGVHEELRVRNPPDFETQRRKYKHHQFLSEDLGQPDLRRHLQKVLTLMQASRSWTEFELLFARVFHADAGSQPSLGMELEGE